MLPGAGVYLVFIKTKVFSYCFASRGKYTIHFNTSPGTVFTVHYGQILITAICNLFIKIPPYNYIRRKKSNDKKNK